MTTAPRKQAAPRKAAAPKPTPAATCKVLVLTAPEKGEQAGQYSVQEITATFDGLRKVIDCERLEPIGGVGSWRGWVANEGIPRRKRANLWATALVKALGWPGISALWGTVVISGPWDDQGNPTDVTPQVLQVFSATVPGGLS